MTYRPVIAPVSPGVRQRIRQPEVCRDFIPGHALVRHAQGLVIDVAIQVTLAFQQFIDVFITPGRPVVLSHQHFGFITPTHNGFVDIF